MKSTIELVLEINLNTIRVINKRCAKKEADKDSA